MTSAIVRVRRGLAVVLAVGGALGLACGDVTSNLIEPEVEELDPCSSDDECGAEQPRCVDGSCVECTSSDDCRNSDIPICDIAGGRCVECVNDGHCKESEERCSPALGICAVPCGSDGSCPEADDPICDTDIGFCVECVVDDDCGDGNFCRASDCFEPKDE